MDHPSQAPEEFTEEQKQYLQGFVSGSNLARALHGLPWLASAGGAASLPPDVTPDLGAGSAPAPPSSLSGVAPAAPTPPSPDAAMHRAQDRFLAEGRKLVPEETAKREKHPLDRWDDMREHAREGRFPKGLDIFALKYHGLFYVAPAENAYMCRLRFPGGILTASQLEQVAATTDRYGGGYAHVTTRANLQIREIAAANAVDVLTALQDAGILNKGAGADNIRNITGSPTAGIDPQELIDTRPFCRELHYAILHDREMYGLPRKFNIAFDGGGAVPVLEETNDIGFAAVRVAEGFSAAPAGIYLRVQLGGITGHGDFARDTGLLLTPEQCVPVAAAIVRVYLEHGDRTDRKKARLKYLLDGWGMDRFVDEVGRRLPFQPITFALPDCEPRGPIGRMGHIGFHPQRQEGRAYVGVVLPVGKMTSDQMRGLAGIAARYGSGAIRLTVWQNLLISDIAESDIPAVKTSIEALGLHWSATQIRAGLVACTGNGGCRFAASDTKSHALAIAAHLESRLQLDSPVNIHLTGCPNSCAQHYIGDIGLLGTTVADGEEVVEGYHVFVGGGYGDRQNLGRELIRGVPAAEVPHITEQLLASYMKHRRSPDESFVDFARRHSVEQLLHLATPAPGARK